MKLQLHFIMVRTVYSPEYCLQYLEQYASQENFVLGLILGQVSTQIIIVLRISSHFKIRHNLMIIDNGGSGKHNSLSADPRGEKS